jgi:multidrug transporter EmrE-like cation transporter
LGYFYILMTICLTVYGQITLKWQVINSGVFPKEIIERIHFLLQLLLNPWVLSSFLAAFFASLFWIMAMTKFQLSHAYPFTSLAFILVMIFSGLFFHEPVTLPKIFGLIFIIIGIFIGSQG